MSFIVYLRDQMIAVIGEYIVPLKKSQIHHDLFKSLLGFRPFIIY